MRDFDFACQTKNCIYWIKEYFEKNGPNSKAIIGISGGKDSTVVAGLCVEALGRDRVIGVILPNGIQPDFDDAVAVCDALGIQKYVCNIKDMYDAALKEIESENISITDSCTTNLPCRLRMSMLYAIAQCVNGRVANTCNASEEYIGWSTRWGDSVGDFAPLAHLLSNEVVSIGKELKTLPTYLVEKTPSDGLCGKSDEEAFGFSYNDLNQYILYGCCDGGPEVSDKIAALHKKNKFKNSPIPSFFPL